MPNRSPIWRCTAVLVAALLVGASAWAQTKGEQKILQGTITDTMCGVKHGMMANKTDKQCTLECVKMGSGYALVVADKVYELEGGKAADLEKLAGAKAKVTGTVSGTKVRVTSVAPTS